MNTKTWARMKLFKNIKLSQQLLYIILIIPSLLIVTLLYYSALQHVTIRNKPLEQLALSTSNTVAEKVDRNLYERYGDVQAFAYNKLAQDACNNKSKDTLLTDFMNTMTSYYVLYDLMMVCSIDGTVLAVNTTDKDKKKLASEYLIGKNMSYCDWFRSSIVVGGPPGGAYYSDFTIDDDIAQLYQNKGFGLDFSAPIKDSKGNVIGVWRNRASWIEITQQIRKEAEQTLNKDVSGGLILLMNKQGQIIDADLQNSILKVHIGKNNVFKDFEFNYDVYSISPEKYLYGWSESKGAYTYKGNSWKYLTLLPKFSASDMSIYINSDWTTLLIVSIGSLMIACIISLLFVRNFSRRLLKIKQSVEKLASGEPHLIKGNKYKDEIGEMSEAINKVHANFIDIASFATKIGQGHLDVSYAPLGERDELGYALIKMKENLYELNNKKEEERWISDTITKLSEQLRTFEINENTYWSIITFIAKAVEARQGALFVIESDHIYLKGSYALSMKYIELTQKLQWGEGMVGQCIIDREIIHLKNLPEDYAGTIESGLGAATPTEVIILPISFNGIMYGALELSFYTPLKDVKITFLKRATEYLGAYLAQLTMNIQKQVAHSDTNENF